MTAKSCERNFGERVAQLDAPGSTLQLQCLTTSFRERLQQTNCKQCLDIWLIGQVNLFSMSYGHVEICPFITSIYTKWFLLCHRISIQANVLLGDQVLLDAHEYYAFISQH
jgi:hypothetical protein